MINIKNKKIKITNLFDCEKSRTRKKPERIPQTKLIQGNKKENLKYNDLARLNNFKITTKLI